MEFYKEKLFIFVMSNYLKHENAWGHWMSFEYLSAGHFLVAYLPEDNLIFCRSLTSGLLHLVSPLPEMHLPSASGILCTLPSFRSLSGGWPTIPLECETFEKDSPMKILRCSCHFRARIFKMWSVAKGIPKTLSGGLVMSNYFLNNAKTLVAIFTMLACTLMVGKGNE